MQSNTASFTLVTRDIKDKFHAQFSVPYLGRTAE